MKGLRRKKSLAKNFFYYRSVLHIILKCFWKRFILPESRVFRNGTAFCLCAVLLAGSMLFQTTISQTNTENLIQDEVSVKLDTEHGAAEEGSEELPYVRITFTNLGDMALENLSAVTEEEEFQVKCLWEEDGEKIIEPENSLEVQVTLKSWGEPGVYKGTLRFEADRVEGEEIVIAIPFQLEIKARTLIEVTEEPKSSQTPEITPQLQVSESAITPVPTADTIELPENTPEADTVSAAPTPSSEVKSTPTVTKPPVSQQDEADSWEIEVTEVSGGYSEGDVYFGIGNLGLKFSLQTAKSAGLKGSYYYTVSDHTEEVKAVDGEAEIELQGPFSGEVTVYFKDKEGRTSAEWKRYCVLDHAAPAIAMDTVMDASGEERVKVVITEPSDVVSGIKQITTYVDGEDYGEYREDLYEVEQQNQWKSKTKSMFYLPLKGSEEHEYCVRVSDNSGNVSEKKIRAVMSSESDVISVIVPTQFSLRMNPYAEDNQVCSDLIPVINLSDFDITMQISSVDVQVNSDNAGAQKKDCDINLDISQCGMIVDSASALVPEEYQSKLLTLEKNQSTSSGLYSNKIDFLSNGISRQILPTVQYREKNVACIQLTGDLTEGSEELWRNGDLNVTIVYDFSKGK